MNDKLSEKVIGAAFQVHNTLGFGFLESVYEKALAVELRKIGVENRFQQPIQVFYDGEVVGDFVADIVIGDSLIVELKSVSKLSEKHEVQLVNYLAATNTETGLLINFGPDKVEVKRKYRTYKPRS